MKLFKQASELARSPKAKQLLRQAKEMDTPENRRKAQALLGKLRKRRAA